MNNENDIRIKPFLKWAGGKFRLLDVLKEKFPKDGKRFIEPFLGAGAVALNVDYPHYIVNDVNSDLVLVWRFLKEMEFKFIDECLTLFIPENNTKERYYELRNEFNITKDDLRKATLFVYLNKHCFNGLCRYNSKGEFNVPQGTYTEVSFPQKEFESVIDKIKKFEILNVDFRELFELVGVGDVVYCDPPYLPLSATADFKAYSDGGFNLKDHLDLAECADNAAKKGAKVIISNHYNWYSHQIYTKLYNAKVSCIEASRVINSKADKRQSVEEIIAVFG